MGAGYEEIEVHWQDGKNVNQPKKTGGVSHWLVNTVEPEQIFYREKQGDAPLHHQEEVFPFLRQRRYRLQHEHHYTEEYHDEQHHVEELSGWGFRFKNDLMQPLPERAEMGWFTDFFLGVEVDDFHSSSKFPPCCEPNVESSFKGKVAKKGEFTGSAIQLEFDW